MNIDSTKYTAHKSPGKFEGEASGATEYFYEQLGDGDGELLCYPLADGPDDVSEDSPVGILFRITSEELEAFDLPVTRRYFLLREDSQGFAYGTCHLSRQEAEAKFIDWARS
jgi:hypothetical protein